MTPGDEYGKTGLGPTHLLPSLAFEMPIDPSVKCGKAEGPVRLLPSLEFDLTEQKASAALQLVVQLREEASPEQVSVDLFRLYAAINELELSYGGAGLRVDDNQAG